MQGYVCRGCLWMLDMVVHEHTPSLPCPHTFFTSSSLHFLFFQIFLCSTERKGRRKERALLIFFISSDCPYNVKEDVARRQKKKDAQIKKLEEAAKEGMLTYIIFNKGLCRCMYCQYRAYIQYLCCISKCKQQYQHVHIQCGVYSCAKFVLFVSP